MMPLIDFLADEVACLYQRARTEDGLLRSPRQAGKYSKTMGKWLMGGLSTKENGNADYYHR